MPSLLTCPFCGVKESRRLRMGGRMMVVFPCMFTAVVKRGLKDEEIQRHLDQHYGGKGGEWFEEKCERLHLLTHKDALKQQAE